MKKIPFKDLPDTSTPYNANTFNTMQDNIEAAINGIQPSGNGTLLWTNESYTTPNNTRITGNIGDYDFIDIVTNDGLTFRTKVSSNYNFYISYVRVNSSGVVRVFSRNVTVSTSAIVFMSAYEKMISTTSTSAQESNDELSPRFVIGYKNSYN